MKKHKYYLKKIVLLLVAIALTISSVIAQDHVSKDNDTGNWDDAGTWTTGDGNITNNDIIDIYGKVNRNSDLSIDNNAVLNVIDTLIIYGNLTVGNNGELNITTGGILIVYGNATMNNKVDVDLDSYFVVFGDYNQGNNSTIDAPADDTLLYVSGGTSCGGGGTVCPDADLVGDEDDMFDNPDLDEIIEATSNFITSRAPTFCAGGSVVLSVRDDGNNYEWFETSDPTTILSKEPTLIVSTAGEYDVDFDIGGTAQSVVPVTVNESGTATHTVTGVVTNESAIDAGDGEIDITVTGATEPVYDWSNGETTKDLSGLTAGEYTVEVEDGGCKVSETFTVGVGVCTDPSLSTVTTPEICNGSSYDLSNIVVVDANSTTPTYTYHSASPALPGNELGSSFVSPTTTATYYILGTNGSCTNELAVDVTVNPLPDATIKVLDNTICEGETLDLTVSVTTGSLNFDITVADDRVANTDAVTNFNNTVWTFNPAVTPVWDSADGVSSEYIYTITSITDGNGCTATNVDNVTVTVYKIPETGPQYHISNEHAR